ncbi:MAG: cytochrome c oxidase subunit II [Oceanospirillaceae bacterium]|jgi:cytochrome c oxidase subunit 2|nr:cytochrome c oxidase subunit II [Oceanospirillaceae bacterium]HCI02023.1 cytochrome c oxidase subunit II [Oceanospirillaceae bacterium]
MKIRTWLSLSSIALLLSLSSIVKAEWGVNMTEGVTEISQSIYDLHMLIFWICVGIGVVVFGVMFYVMFKHRKSKGAVAAQFDESVTLEWLWTVIPTIILIAMAVPATKTLVEMYDASDAQVDIKITGYQWKWQYDYLGEDVSFFSNLSTSRDAVYNKEEKGENYLLEVDKEVVIPTGQKVRFLITSNDVIHAWWVPEFAVKKDAIPGYVNESWVNVPVGQEGVYRGQCAELCGVDHGFMPIVVRAVSQSDYATWLDEQRAEKEAAALAALGDYSFDELMTTGAEVYAGRCAACHGQNGEGMGSMFPPMVGSDIVLNDVDKHIDILINGVAGSAMQSFAEQLTDVEIAAVITYERNAWGNDTGDIVTPRDIIDARQ